MLPKDLSPGFHIGFTDRSEAVSPLSAMINCATFDYTAKNSIAAFRKLFIEIMSWNASHSVSSTPYMNYEGQ
jgi:hypothetical protein